MNRSKAILSLLIGVGITSILIAIYVLRPGFDPADAGHPELATVFIVIISLGFVVTGVTWLLKEDRDRYRRIPAATISVLGASAILGGFVVFRPWEYGGLAFGVRWLWTWILVAVGIIYLEAGRQWIRKREFHYPLAFLSSSLAAAWFIVYYERMLRSVSPLAFALIALGVAVVPFVTVLYGTPGATPAR